MSSAKTRSWLQILAVCVAVALVLFVWPTDGFARARLSNGETPDTPEGDPIDSNDYGGGGSGGDGGDDVDESYAVAPTPRPPVIRIGDWVIVIVPDATSGSAGFTFRIVDLGAFAAEAWYAQ